MNISISMFMTNHFLLVSLIKKIAHKQTKTSSMLINDQHVKYKLVTRLWLQAQKQLKLILVNKFTDSMNFELKRMYFNESLNN